MDGHITIREKSVFVNKNTPDVVNARCVGVSKNYLRDEWQWKVEYFINNKCVQERRSCSVRD